MLGKVPPDVEAALKRLAGDPDWEKIRAWLQSQAVELAGNSLMITDPQREALMRQVQGGSRALTELYALSTRSR
jgi:hypothetical protein